MTDTLPQSTIDAIKADANLYSQGKHYGIPREDGYIAGATAQALKAEQLKELLRFAGCPELLIENPTLIKGKKPTDEDMEWARGAIERHETFEQQQALKAQELVKALEKIENILESDVVFTGMSPHQQQTIYNISHTAIKNYNNG